MNEKRFITPERLDWLERKYLGMSMSEVEARRRAGLPITPEWLGWLERKYLEMAKQEVLSGCQPEQSEQNGIIEAIDHKAKVTQPLLPRLQDKEPPLPPIVIIDPFEPAIPPHRALTRYVGEQGDTARE